MDRLFRRNRPLTNPESIDAIPDRVIMPDVRLQYRRRALAGEDVYAYQSANPDETWNIWDTDTRIVLPLLPKVWHIRVVNFLGNGLWHVLLFRRDEERDIRFTINPHPQYDRDDETIYGPRYQARAHRRILDIINHCAHNDIDPARLEGGHY